MKDGQISLQGTPNEVWEADPDLKISRIAAAESDVSEAEAERKRLQQAVEELKKEEQGTGKEAGPRTRFPESEFGDSVHRGVLLLRVLILQFEVSDHQELDVSEAPVTVGLVF